MSSTAVTIGNFDGVHVGHARLIKRAREAVGPSGRVIALVFDPHPLTTLKPGISVQRLTSFGQRQSLLESLGVDAIERLEPDQEFLSQSGRSFIETIASSWSPDFLVEGPDFRFGHRRADDLDSLRRFGSQLGFELIEVPPAEVSLRDQSIVRASSSMTRWLLGEGRVRDAALVLDRPYEVWGRVVQGDRRGRAIGFPTCNIQLDQAERSAWSIPSAGVYAAVAHLRDGGPTDTVPAAVNIGVRPTFDGEGVRIEAHLLLDQADQSWAPLSGREEYGWRIGLEFISRVRDEVRFGSVEQLREQLTRDVRLVESRIGVVGADRRSPLEIGAS